MINGLIGLIVQTTKQSSNNIIINEIQEMSPALGDLESIRRKARGMDMKEDSLIKFVGTFKRILLR